MFKLGTYYFCIIVAFHTFGMVSPQDGKDSECVLTDAPNQCGAFCMSAQRPLFEHNRIIQNQINQITTLIQSIENELKNKLTKLGDLQIEQVVRKELMKMTMMWHYINNKSK
ncbi:uncharacterized protein Dsimw501_GD27282 [Drosophila simulans]|uniref:Uncharacterized protein n=1 Tax=Drosophila simulans TaxID=7240 RepID=A0A0J9QVD3_DROSI|nr:uncharacterized protein Dsimw501_GD27282 [Drosophila simulans]